jgi:hypothetical protein
VDADKVLDQIASIVDDDGDMVMSSAAMEALRSHLADTDTTPDEGPPVRENYNLSQFWYTDETSRTLAAAAVDHAGPGGRIAIVSAPSAFEALKKMAAEEQQQEAAAAAAVARSGGAGDAGTSALGGTGDAGTSGGIYTTALRNSLILEYDRRFGDVYGDHYVFYDFNEPTDLPEQLRGTCDYILLDPPYLTEPCLALASETVKWLGKSDKVESVLQAERQLAEAEATEQQVGAARGSVCVPTMLCSGLIQTDPAWAFLGLKAAKW